jgi:lysophospholipid acyltransferase (LPLAT)-like uncharacterized protein
MHYQSSRVQSISELLLGAKFSSSGILLDVLTFLSYLYLSFVALTSRIRIVSVADTSILALRERSPAVFTFWYDRVFFLLYFFGVRRMPILMTPKGNTDFMTKLSEWMGLQVAKGSLEGGGRHALVALLEELKARKAVIVPADGSRGPAHKCKAGPFILAQDAGAPIIPVTWKALFQIALPIGSSKVFIPLPFNSIEVRLGTPLVVSRHYQFAELDAIKSQLSTQLDRMGEEK